MSNLTHAEELPRRPRSHAVSSSCEHLNVHIPNVLSVFFINIQGLKEKTDDLEVVLFKHNFMVACLCEHWLRAEEIEFYVPLGYILGNSYCRNNLKRGGVAIFVSKTTVFEKFDVSSYCIEQHFEVTAVKISSLQTIVISVYRSPLGKTEIFLQSLENILTFIVCFECKVVICGDLNAEFDVNSKKSSV